MEVIVRKASCIVLTAVLALVLSAVPLAAASAAEAADVAGSSSEVSSLADLVITVPKPPAPKNKQTTVKFPQKKVYIVKGKKLTVPAKGYDAAGKSVKLTYWSSDARVATVNSKGRITAKKTGTVRITATGPGVKKGTLTVKVVDRTKRLNSTSMHNLKHVLMRVGDVQYASGMAFPASATGVVYKYSSSNKRVATVDSSGRIKAVGVGRARIMVNGGVYSGWRTVIVGRGDVPVNQIIYDENGVVVKADKLRYYFEDDGFYRLHVTIWNNSGKTVTLSLIDTKVNKLACTVFTFETILNNDRISTGFDVHEKNMGKLNIASIRELEFRLDFFDRATSGDLFCSDRITIRFLQ